MAPRPRSSTTTLHQFTSTPSVHPPTPCSLRGAHEDDCRVVSIPSRLPVRVANPDGAAAGSLGAGAPALLVALGDTGDGLGGVLPGVLPAGGGHREDGLPPGEASLLNPPDPGP